MCSSQPSPDNPQPTATQYATTTPHPLHHHHHHHSHTTRQNAPTNYIEWSRHSESYSTPETCIPNVLLHSSHPTYTYWSNHHNKAQILKHHPTHSDHHLPFTNQIPVPESFHYPTTPSSSQTFWHPHQWQHSTPAPTCNHLNQQRWPPATLSSHCNPSSYCFVAGEFFITLLCSSMITLQAMRLF